MFNALSCEVLKSLNCVALKLATWVELNTDRLAVLKVLSWAVVRAVICWAVNAWASAVLSPLRLAVVMAATWLLERAATWVVSTSPRVLLVSE